MAEVAEIEGESEDVHTVRVAADSDVPLSTHVVEAVATAAGVDSTELGFDVYDAVDADALDALHRHAWRVDAAWELTFEVADREVVVSSDGTVTVT